MPSLAIVTGAARRVGRAVAIELARAGFDVVLTWRTRRAEADATAADAVAAARTAGHAEVRADPVHLDLSSDESVAAFVARFQGRPLDALVLSASSYARTPFGTITAATAAEEWRVNAQSPLLLVQGLRGPLEASTLAGGACVVAFTDIHAHGHPRRAYAPYLMSKAALAAMVECLSVELAPRVRVNAIAPGVIAWPDDAPADERARYEARIPLARPGTPEDAARLVRAIALDMPYVTGTTIRLDGGRALR